MYLTRSIAIAGLAAITAVNACAATAPAPPKPAVTKAIIAEQPLQVTQPSPEAMYRACDAVAHVKIVSSHPALIPGRGPMPSVFTVLEANVLETVKGTLPAHIKIYQKAGQYEDATHIYRVADLEAVSAGAEYLLFINWNDTLGAYVVGGNEGAYEVDTAGSLRALAHSSTATAVGQKTLRSIENDVRVANSKNKNDVQR